MRYDFLPELLFSNSMSIMSTSDDMISCLPVYKNAFFFSFLLFLVFSVSFFWKILKKVYNIQNNRLCFHDMKNLSLRLG